MPCLPLKTQTPLPNRGPLLHCNVESCRFSGRKNTRSGIPGVNRPSNISSRMGQRHFDVQFAASVAHQRWSSVFTFIRLKTPSQRHRVALAAANPLSLSLQLYVALGDNYHHSSPRIARPVGLNDMLFRRSRSNDIIISAQPPPHYHQHSSLDCPF